jgi:HD-GYP domain-containing protein (c-di-GMP phosphodiesterase class II)
MFQAVVREIGQVLGADRADVLVVDSSGPELQFHSVAAFDTKGDGEVTISRTILTEAAQKGEAILTSNAAADQRFAQAQSIVQGALRSILCVPVIAGGEAAGVLYVCNSQRADAFSREDLELATQISLQLGASLSLLRLFEKREATLRASLQAAVRALAGDAPIHAERAEAVARYARAIAHALGLGPEEANCAWIAGMLHSLEAPPPAESGAEGAGARAAGLEEVRRAIEFQDARHDGSGSPALRGDQIPPLGRVLSLAKEIDRLTREGGPEGKPLSIGEALQKAPPLAGAGFHPDVVQAALVAARNGALLGDPGALDLGP